MQLQAKALEFSTQKSLEQPSVSSPQTTFTSKQYELSVPARREREVSLQNRDRNLKSIQVSSSLNSQEPSNFQHYVTDFASQDKQARIEA